uniref:EOG090X07V0 n=1 Tax=Ceriodaphnia reticulata TaxID=302197 RepID=A0A4Y7LXH8_9CRUS|nr:EOG090X07V0 [Ceriodaphnia reticulata]
MDRSGNMSANSYMRGVSVKITEKYRPPRRPTLPPGLCHFEPASHLFCENMELFDESSALKLVASIRDLHAEETCRRKLKISELENQAAAEEKEIDDITASVSLTNLTNNIPQQNIPPSMHAAMNGSVMPHTQATMEVLTPIQSSTVENKKKENMSAINLAEFESYSTNPFEEMELKTLNDKEELAMLLQPAAPQQTNVPLSAGTLMTSYGHQYQFNPSVMSWPERVPEPYPTVRQFDAAASWIPNETIARGNLRQAKSVPDLTDSNFGCIGRTPVNNHTYTGSSSSDKRLSSRTPPPRLTSDSISRPMPKPIINVHQCPWEKSLNPIEKRLVQQLQDMGFLLDRSARAIARLGANEKDVVDQLLLIQKFEDIGHSTERIESALDILKPSKELPKQLEQHLALVDQLSALGFDQVKIGSALVVAGHDRDKALDILLMK